MKIIDNSQIVDCWKCNGTGIEMMEDLHPAHKVINQIPCSICKGTGKWKEDHYFFVIKDKNGQQIAFDGDQGGK